MGSVAAAKTESSGGEKTRSGWGGARSRVFWSATGPAPAAASSKAPPRVFLNSPRRVVSTAETVPRPALPADVAHRGRHRANCSLKSTDQVIAVDNHVERTLYFFANAMAGLRQGNGASEVCGEVPHGSTLRVRRRIVDGCLRPVLGPPRNVDDRVRSRGYGQDRATTRTTLHVSDDEVDEFARDEMTQIGASDVEVTNGDDEVRWEVNVVSGNCVRGPERNTTDASEHGRNRRRRDGISSTRAKTNNGKGGKSSRHDPSAPQTIRRTPRPPNRAPRPRS